VFAHCVLDQNWLVQLGFPQLRFDLDYDDGTEWAVEGGVLKMGPPEALISHDSAPVQSTSVAGTILDYSSFLTQMSNWTCVEIRCHLAIV
jgi:hypothetical protein